MLLEKIQSNALLSPYLRPTCDENDVGVAFDPSVLATDYVIIKVDAYFTAAVTPTPRGNDCLIVQKCADNRYKLYLIELKNIKGLNTGEGIIKHIYDKFQNCFDILMSDHFRDLFYDETYQFSDIKLYFVSHLKKDKKQKNTRLDALLTYKSCRFAGRRFGLESKEPNPMITPC